MGKYEIELRGRLTEEEEARLETFLAKNGELVKSYERTQWCFGLSRDKKIDLRIKKTNGQPEFSLKVGSLGEANRREIVLPIPADKIEEAFDFLKFLGHTEGVIAVRNAKIYLYRGIEWALVEAPGHSRYFEAEKLVSTQEEGVAAEKEIKSVVKELGLRLLSPEETVEYIKILDEEVNEKFYF